MRPEGTRTPRTQRIAELWLAAGLVFTTATQLRVPGTPAGIGEAMLALWMGVTFARTYWSGRLIVTPMARAMVAFWALAAALLMAGTVSAILVGVGPSTGALHDAVALTFAATALLLFTTRPGLERRATQLGADLLTIGVPPLVFILFATVGFRTLGPINPWYGFRFCGWAENPNQLALGVAALPFFGVRAYAEVTRTRTRLRFIALTLGAVLIGIATASDALALAWALSAAIVVPVFWLRAARRPTRSLLRAAFLRVLIPVVVGGGGVVVAARVAVALEDEVAELYNMGGQGSLRVHLWVTGLRAMAASPVVGLGPGGHSGLIGPHENEEAHNTFVDWASSTGILGVSLYLVLLGWLVHRAWRRRDTLMLSADLALITFTTLHFVLRQPLFWFSLLAIAAEAEVAGPKEPGDDRAPAGGGGGPFSRIHPDEAVGALPA